MSTLLVFRNNLSHARYNEARLIIGLLKNALRGMYQQIHGCVSELEPAVVKDPESAAVVQYREKSKVVLKQITVSFKLSLSARSAASAWGHTRLCALQWRLQWFILLCARGA